MHSHSIRLLALVAGGLLSVIPSPRAAHAATPGGSANLIRLPPQLTGASQSAEVLAPGGTAQLSIQATDPQGSPLTFSWGASAGTLGTPVNTGNSSSQTWTAPQCLAPDDTPVAATVTNAYGLSTSALFPFSVPQDLSVNRQPPFTPSGFESLVNVAVTPQQTLRMTAPSVPTSADRIVFAQDQLLRVTFVDKYAGATHAFGYVYYDDLVARGYVNTQGTPDSADDTLVDANGNGILDLHEDLYGLAPTSGPQARPYIGVSRRCTSSFTSGGFQYSQPELALNANCTSAFLRQELTDARPGHTFEYYMVDVVGAFTPSATSPSAGFSDQGLFGRLPNLLEPRDAANNFMGLGSLVFLNTDDDFNVDTYRALGLVPDATSADPNGIPDYDVSRYDLRGQVRAVNPDPGITAADRTVDLGVIPGGRELVFFLVTAFEMSHNVDNGTVFPCLRKAANGQCTLHLKTPLSVFFSKAKWNLDQDPLGTVPTAQRNIGCNYSDSCRADSPQTSATACTVYGTSQKLCGWLDSEVRDRLTTPAYGGVSLPLEAASVPAPGNGNMPHALLVAPSTQPSPWMLGFEDLNGGGDRDFNDFVVLFQGLAGSTARSKVLNPPDAGCAVSRVRFQKTDVLPPGCEGLPTPSYEVATDCNVCGPGFCAPNPNPTWRPLPLLRGTDTVTVDVSDLSGNQLCWRLSHIGGTPACLPTVTNVSVGYELTSVAP
ncbi:DUF4114 domain-containing protein [Corallococcus exercitus]|uniref:DUF4114 domain-containing protein n=1 Tax=Corallococcus exercitus TaxID=2316736 RepID=UPI0035D48383